MDEIIQGYPEVNLSITNPNVRRENALDRNVAFTFLEFIKNVPEFYEPTHSLGSIPLNFDTGLSGLEGDDKIFDIMIRDTLFSSLSLFEG